MVASPSEELQYLKSLVTQLNDKIKHLEANVLPSPPPSPAEQLRLILIGPPGAGTFDELFTSILSFPTYPLFLIAIIGVVVR